MDLYHAGIRQHQQGNLDEAEALYRAVLCLVPAHPGSLQLLGTAAYQKEKFERASLLLNRAICIDDGVAEYHGNLSAVLADLTDYPAALRQANIAMVLKPDLSDALVNASAAHRRSKEHAPAELWGLRALRMAPTSSAAMHNAGLAMHAADRLAEALVYFKSAAVLVPGDAKIQANLGVALGGYGKRDAKSCVIHSLRIRPRTLEFLGKLTDLHRFVPGDEWITQMEGLELDISSRRREDQITFHFTMAKALGDLREHKRAFDHLLIANRLRREAISYDEERVLAYLSSIKHKFTPARLAQSSGKGTQSERPIFIVGLPRSGTTLIEQILDSHPLVHGAGELHFFQQEIEAAAAAHDLEFPEQLGELSDEALAAVGAAYLRRLPPTKEDISRVVDKMPGNLYLAGEIHVALPNARIIQLRRDPVDVCLSCFSKNFTGPLDFTYDLAELGRYAQASVEIMDHWERILPQSAFLSVHYTDVVQDLEQEARRILAFCGLPWSDSVLDFHKNERLVKTASAQQVRNPIYKTSLQRWRPDEAVLKPLLDALEPRS